MKFKILFFIMAVHVSLACQPVSVQLNRYMERFHSENPRPGMAAVVVRQNRVLLMEGYGVTRIGSDIAVTPDTVFQLGSITKSMTSLAALELERQGVVNLDDPVVATIPWFRTANKEWSDTITLGMLLSNSSGIPSVQGNLFKHYNSLEEGLAEQVRAMGSLSLPFRPGSSFLYSNSGYALAGLVLSEAAGMDYEDLMQKLLFIPLGMDQTRAVPDGSSRSQDHYGHGWAPEQEMFALEKVPLQGGNLEPAGSRLVTSAADMSRYLQHLLYLDAPLQKLYEPRISHRGLSRDMGGQSEQNRYALGLAWENIDGRELIYHSGGTGTFSSIMMLDRASRTAALIMANTGDLDPFGHIPLVTAANNLLHIANGESLSSYGIPVIDDPSIPREPIPVKEESYGGVFRITAESSESMAPREVVIEPSGKGLKAVLYTNQLFARFDLEFFSASSAAAVSIGPSLAVDFDISLEGQVVGLETFGARYVRYTPPGEDFRLRYWKDFEFVLPETWRLESGAQRFRAQDKDDPRFSIEAGLMATPSDAALLEESFSGDGTLSYPRELIGKHYIKQFYRRVKINGSDTQQLLLTSRIDEQWVYFVLTLPAGELTETVQDVLRPMIISFSQVHGA